MAAALWSPTTQQLYQGAGHHKLEERKPEESLAPINVESKVAGSIPPQDDGVFLAAFLQNLAIMMYLYMCLFSLGWEFYLCIMWQMVSIVTSLQKNRFRAIKNT